VAVIPVADTPDDALTGRKGSAASAEASPALIEAIVRALDDNGAGPGSSIHSWRCKYPDMYGPCDCVKETARDLWQAIVEHLGLTWESGVIDQRDPSYTPPRRLVSQWVEVHARHLVRYSNHLDDHDADNAARERARQCPDCRRLNDARQP
jgi:hypothetical protein